MLNEQLCLLRSSSVMTAPSVAGLPDATATIRAKSGLGIGDADSKAARLAADRGKHREAAGDNPQALAQ
jgi:hypothetical protein